MSGGFRGSGLFLLTERSRVALAVPSGKVICFR